MRISDWSSDVCSSDLPLGGALLAATLAPLDEHHVLHDRGAPLLVGRRQLDQGHLALLAEGAGILADVAVHALVGGLAADVPVHVLELGALLVEEGLRPGAPLPPEAVVSRGLVARPAAL